MFAGLRELLRSGAIRDIGSKSGTIYFLSPPLVTLTLYNSGGRCPVPIVIFYPTKSGRTVICFVSINIFYVIQTKSDG